MLTIVLKAGRLIKTSKNRDQLRVAVRYASLCSRRLLEEGEVTLVMPCTFYLTELAQKKLATFKPKLVVDKH